LGPAWGVEGYGAVPQGCVFCAIVAGEAPAQFLHQDEGTVAFMDINPATDGHLLVVPKRHAADIWDLPEDDGVAVWRTVHRMAEAIRESLRPDGLNLIQANGPVAFQTIFHFHVHVVPRYAGDAIRLPWIPRPGDRAKIGEAAERIRAVL
jgi:histidine triad (HIT) family protein